MDTNNKYGSFGRDMLIRYLKGELSAEDSWKIEKAMQEDPLLSEAMEGLEGFSNKDLIGRDIAELEQRVNTRSAKAKTRTLPVLMRIAAAFLILTVSTYIIIELTGKKPQNSPGIAMQKPAMQKNTDTISTYSDGGTKKAEEIIAASPSGIKKPEIPAVRNEKATEIFEDKDVLEIEAEQAAEKSEIKNQPVPSEPDAAGSDDKKADISKDAQAGPVTDFILADSPDEEEPRPGVLDDYVTKGAGAVSRDREETRETRPSGQAKAALSEQTVTINYLEPHPVNGDSSYVEYIRANLQYPEMASRNNIEGDVILRFSVGADSSLSNINVISGPGRGCNEEAARLVREGPKWVPAFSNSIPVISEVYYKIPFRIP